MLERIIRLSIRQRWAILAIVVLLSVVGIYNFSRLKIDAVPDITNVQVQVSTPAPGFSPLEAEQRITFPVETALAGVPGLEYTRSVSRAGLSQVTVVFAKVGQTYEVRMLELGQKGALWTEVLSGIKPGQAYVTKGSYVIKADIEKAGASHDH